MKEWWKKHNRMDEKQNDQKGQKQQMRIEKSMVVDHSNNKLAFLEENMLDCYIKSLYLCVKDMERAVRFYENFLEQEVTIKNEIYSVFDINGFRLGLFAFEKMNEKHSFGSNCLPSIHVANLDILKRKIKDLELCFPLTQIDTDWVVEFVDSEGNHIELTTPI